MKDFRRRRISVQRRHLLEKRAVKSTKKVFLCRSFMDCGSGFCLQSAAFQRGNHDFPGNRGRRPLPPTNNFHLNDLDFYLVSNLVSAVLLTPETQSP